MCLYRALVQLAAPKLGEFIFKLFKRLFGGITQELLGLLRQGVKKLLEFLALGGVKIFKRGLALI